MTTAERAHALATPRNAPLRDCPQTFPGRDPPSAHAGPVTSAEEAYR